MNHCKYSHVLQWMQIVKIRFKYHLKQKEPNSDLNTDIGRSETCKW